MASWRDMMSDMRDRHRNSSVEDIQEERMSLIDRAYEQDALGRLAHDHEGPEAAESYHEQARNARVEAVGLDTLATEWDLASLESDLEPEMDGPDMG